MRRESVCIFSGSFKLYWFAARLNGQHFDFLLDCGATVCCIAKRCVASNRVLRNLPRSPYKGPQLCGANNQPLQADTMIKLTLEVGTPTLRMDIDFVIVEDLPYSCIAGNGTFLASLKQWGVNNEIQTLTLNFSVVNLSTGPQSGGEINLITSYKVMLKLGETKVIKTIARGHPVAAARPYTTQTIIVEGHDERENRTSVHLQPSICHIGDNNDFVIPISVTNTSAQNRTIGKGVKIAYC